MEDPAIKKMVLELIKEIDYDHWKFYMPKLSEDPEGAATSMETLIGIVKKHLKKSCK
jgi:hypothetical protein